MSDENSSSVYLARNVSIAAAVSSCEKIYIHAEDVNFGGHPSELKEAITAFIRNLTRLGQQFVDFEISTGHNGQGCVFDVGLYKVDLEPLCKILPPGPFLDVRCQMSVAHGHWEVVKFERRFLLTDILEALNSQAKTKSLQCLFSWDAPQPESTITITYDLVLGWDGPSAKMRMDGNSFAQNLFGMEASKDLVLVAGNGAQIKCHRMVLQGHSDALAAMVSLGNGMKESQSGRIDMSSHSEEAVSKFVRYLYGFELDSQELPCDVAVQLFKLADMYGLAQLQETLVNMLLLKKGKGWYTPDQLLELHFHVKHLDHLRNLREHTLGVMVSLNQEIRVCERFLEMEQTDPKSAISLMWQLFDFDKK